jgi:hypothetical protein
MRLVIRRHAATKRGFLTQLQGFRVQGFHMQELHVQSFHAFAPVRRARIDPTVVSYLSTGI